MILLSKTLRYFIVTAQEQSIRMAALILCITPSPLCRTIKIFELNLGHKLFTRTNNGLKLTNYGRDLYATLLPLYQEICEIEKKVIKKTHQIQSGKASIKIGLDHRDYSYLSPFLSSPVFKDAKNNISLEYFTSDETDIGDILNKGLCQIFFTQKKIQCPPGLIHQTLSTDVIMLAVKSDLKTEDYSQNELFMNKILVQYEANKNEEIFDDIEGYIANNQLNPKRVFIPELYVQLSMIEKGDAIGLMPSSIINIINDRNFKVKFIPFDCDDKKLVIERHIYYTPAHQAFMEEKMMPLITNHDDKCLTG